MIRVLIVDDQRLAREALRVFLTREKDILIVGEARNGREAIELTCELEPDIILMDIKMPLLDGIQATKRICETHSHAKIMIFAGSYEEALVHTALQYGAQAYIAKHEGLLELGKAVRTVYAGQTYFSPSVAELLPPSN